MQNITKYNFYNFWKNLKNLKKSIKKFLNKLLYFAFQFYFFKNVIIWNLFIYSSCINYLHYFNESALAVVVEIGERLQILHKWSA